MHSTSRTTRAAAALTAVAATLFVAACATESVTAPAAGIRGVVAVAQPQLITVCKAAGSPAGTYQFAVGATEGSVNPGDTRLDAFSLTIPAGGSSHDVCTTVYQRTEAQTAFSDAPAFVTVTEGAAPGTTLSAINATSGGEAPVVNLPARSVRLFINAFHGSTAVFVNEAVHTPPPPTTLGCTYTQGWYKNKGKATIAGRTLNGVSYLTILNTAPKGGDAYLILAHQFIAATMNVEGGAFAPAPVADALADASAYFAGTGSFTRDEVIALSATLDRFNNGLAPGGPAHCD